jgi:hypothetical protein
VTGRTKAAVAAAGVAAVGLAAVGFIVFTGAGASEEPAGTAEPTATTQVGPPWPLTGVPSAPGDPLDRPAVAVKISNSEQARPQAGIDQADQVWEEQVEGISRLIAVFHSKDAAPVGPIRSARDSDLDLLGAFGTPVFVWGGGNEGVAARAEAAPLVSINVDPDDAEYNYRDDERTAPDNLFIEGTEPFYATPGATAPVAQFAYRGADVEPAGQQTLGAEISWGSSEVAYVWDEGSGGWARYQDGTPQVDTEGRQMTPANVVVLLTEYGSAPSDPRSPVAITVGEGEANVFSTGRQIPARWSRPSPAGPYAVTDAATGLPVELAPGATWVALAERGRTAFVEEARVEELRNQPTDSG